MKDHLEKNILEKIKTQIKKALKNSKASSFSVAFDADGTLWPGDVGKNFFLYQVEKGFLKKKTPRHPQEVFDQICETKGKKEALCWLAQIQAGFSLKHINKMVFDFLRERPFKVFLFQKQLITWLLSQNVNVFIVSSSLKWVLDQALLSYGLRAENIIGVETLVREGIITKELVTPPPIREEKVGAFKKKAGDGRPIFSAGNTLSDQALLEYASLVRLVLSTAKEGERNYESERKLLSLAKKRNWLIQNGMPDLV